MFDAALPNQLKKMLCAINTDETDRIAPCLKSPEDSEIDDRTLLGPSLVNEITGMAKTVRPLQK